MKISFIFSLIILISCNEHKITILEDITYSQLGDNERMIYFHLENFKINNDEVIKQVKIDISTTKTKIGIWQGVFGTSTIVKPDYWYMTENMKQSLNDNEGSIIWDVPEEIREIIQCHYDGKLLFGIWWIDCDSFTIKSVTIITS